jgi:hypothetical protein
MDAQRRASGGAVQRSPTLPSDFSGGLMPKKQTDKPPGMSAEPIHPWRQAGPAPLVRLCLL